MENEPASSESELKGRSHMSFVLSVLYDIIILRVVNSRHVKISDNNNIKFNQ